MKLRREIRDSEEARGPLDQGRAVNGSAPEGDRGQPAGCLHAGQPGQGQVDEPRAKRAHRHQRQAVERLVGEHGHDRARWHRPAATQAAAAARPRLTTTWSKVAGVSGVPKHPQLAIAAPCRPGYGHDHGEDGVGHGHQPAATGSGQDQGDQPRVRPRPPHPTRTAPRSERAWGDGAPGGPAHGRCRRGGPPWPRRRRPAGHSRPGRGRSVPSAHLADAVDGVGGWRPAGLMAIRADQLVDPGHQRRARRAWLPRTT